MEVDLCYINAVIHISEYGRSSYKILLKLGKINADKRSCITVCCAKLKSSDSWNLSFLMFIYYN